MIRFGFQSFVDKTMIKPHFSINQTWNPIHKQNQAIFMSERRHDLDALRSFAMLLGLGLHASFSFFSAPWPVHDSRQNILLGLVYVAIHGFRMQLFFLLSGFFTMLLFRRRGIKSLLKQRLARIVVPLVVGCATIIPAFEIISKAAIQINRQEPLVASILSGQLDSVRDQLKNKEIASSEDHIFHYTMLEWAAMHGSPETIDLLVQAGIDVNRQNSRGDTPLHLSVYYGRDLAVVKLIELGADPRISNNSGDLPIDIRHTSADAAAETSTLYGLPEMNPEEVVRGREKIAKLLDVRSAENNTGSVQKIVRNYWSFMASERFRIGHGDWSLHLFQTELLDHLWFLWFLCWFVMAFAIAEWFGILPGSDWRWVFILLSCIPQVFMGGRFGPTFGPDGSFSLLPQPHMLAYYGCFFFFGVATFDKDEIRNHSNRAWPFLLLASIGLLLPAGIIKIDNWTLAMILQPAYAWAMSLGMIGLFQRWFARPNPTVTWLSDASYWIYLTHLPLVIVLQVMIRDIPLPSFIKFISLIMVTTLILLITYERFVRYTLIGTMLNGPRSKQNDQTQAISCK